MIVTLLIRATTCAINGIAKLRVTKRGLIMFGTTMIVLVTLSTIIYFHNFVMHPAFKQTFVNIINYLFGVF